MAPHVGRSRNERRNASAISTLEFVRLIKVLVPWNKGHRRQWICILWEEFWIRTRCWSDYTILIHTIGECTRHCRTLAWSNLSGCGKMNGCEKLWANGFLVSNILRKINILLYCEKQRLMPELSRTCGPSNNENWRTTRMETPMTIPMTAATMMTRRRIVTKEQTHFCRVPTALADITTTLYFYINIHTYAHI